MTLDQLRTSSDPIIKAAADRAAQLIAYYQAGEITKNELDEFTANEIDLEKFAKDVTDLSRKVALQEAFDILIQIIQIASSLKP